MIRSFAFTTAGKLHTKDIEPFLMPTLLADTNLFLWVDLENPNQAEWKEVLEKIFHFHPLSIEDCVQPSPSPKVEEYSPKEGDLFTQYLFMVIHAVDYDRKDGCFATSELDFFLGKNFLVTYHEKPLRSVSSVEERAVNGTMGIARAPDRVAHSLLDALVDNYKPALDELGLEIAELEQEALQKPTKETLNKILQVKKEVMHLRRIIGPQREVLGRFAQGDFKLVRPTLVPYFRDVYDGLFQIGELAQSYADSLTGILQVYLNMSSNQTGEVVKLLTLITVITTPLMMIGTWYGMNFKDMPELDYKHAYPIAGAAMILSTIATYLYFKMRKWF
ncbi:MAG TPA: magnesium/cobalt transporter CorA [Candidatus Acidoferrales bacterium]|jgi:magnesium transporter|nr:magnesium/cobalt transporter CorA [Candidatus Acidoferrales bacterium]